MRQATGDHSSAGGLLVDQMKLKVKRELTSVFLLFLFPLAVATLQKLS
jgi:hypothetical protein